MSRIAITGASGFLGQCVVKLSKEAGHEVTGIDLKGTDLNVDLTEAEYAHLALQEARPEVVIQLAALAGATGNGGGAESLKEPWKFIDNNIRIVNNVFEACRKLQILRVINMASFAGYGNAPCPITEKTPMNANNPYGASKVCIEEIAKVYARCYGIKTITFRAPLICGENQRENNALQDFVNCAITDKPLEVWNNGSTLREWVHPEDVARAYLLALERFKTIGLNYETFILGNEPIKILDLANLVVQVVGKGKVKLHPEKPKLYDQWTDHTGVFRALGWEPKILVEEIVKRVIKERMEFQTA
jgi:nucleoside-diphosphate-sugar epimerase